MIVTFNPAHLEVGISGQGMGVSTGTPIAREYVDRLPYEGEYVITPSGQEQILQTKNLRMTDNVVVNPIPQNYGLITWDGSTITVS